MIYCKYNIYSYIWYNILVISWDLPFYPPFFWKFDPLLWNSANFFKFQELIAVLRTGDYFGEAPTNASANPRCTLLETNMSPPNAAPGKMIFLFQRWNMLVPWRVIKYEVKFMVWNRRNSLSLSLSSPLGSLGIPKFPNHQFEIWCKSRNLRKL